MTQNRVVLAAAALLGVILTSDAAAMMRGDVTVAGPQITLGDLFDDAAGKAATTVAQAPMPGQQMTFRVAYLSALASRHGLDPARLPDRKYVSVVRAADIVPTDRLLKLIADGVKASGVQGRFEIKLTGKRNDLQVAVGTAETVPLSLVGFQIQRDDARFYAVVAANAGSRHARQVKLLGRIVAIHTVPVLTRDVAKGEIIGPLDIDWIETNAKSARRNIVLDEQRLIGAQAARHLHAGEPVKRRDLQTPVLVHKNALVTVFLRHNGLSLTMTGRALSDGGRGDLIAIMNQQSKRTIQAEVIGQDQVAVFLTKQVATARSK